ncbi:hypothetical protein H7I53_10305 [Mycolicibacterium pulveris]|uniref:Uncharacterized protein n=1 Tax=Mycolicibacterium pulveris TaxID=36813 RepID=A0A7I7UKQ7_MYCPV|nr:hypothetical protein [Mycolicibacterium pulveris]MCV6980612.1 hypothetical protein [Mycolicibacterium pulveris]BBY82012.1 hypothetical protein MPUL_31700 [Mycolicibacterium pulveris]
MSVKTGRVNVRGKTIPVGYQCPDCDNDVRIVPMGEGVSVLQVIHDDTCPWLGKHK